MKNILLFILFICSESFAQSNNYNVLDKNTAAITGGTISGATITTSTYNGNTLTTGSSTYTGTAGQTYIFPTTSATIARTDIGQTFTGNQALTNGASNAGYTATTSAGFSFLNLIVGSTHYNWLFSCQNVANNGCEIMPSTATGGSTYTTPVLNWNQTGQVFMPGLGSSSAATTGTLCWTTGTGLVNVDTTTTCLLSSLEFKEKVSALESATASLMKMRPVSYQLKPQYDPAHLGRQIGFIAEEIALVEPRLVANDERGNPHAVRYQQMTALLVKGFQEQQQQIKELRVFLYITFLVVFCYLIIYFTFKKS